MTQLYDMHCHLLPGVDDGCRNTEETLAVLQQSAVQGISGIAATSHYYPQESVPDFVRRRNAAVRQLQEALQQNPVQRPRICLGAEVAYYPGLVYEEHLDRLCIGKSGFLLLELPFGPWAPSVIRDVQRLRSALGIVPIIAHLERYMSFQNKRTLEELLDSDVLIQMNAGFILNPKSQRTAKKLLKKNWIQLLGSDCHNPTSRPQNLAAAYAKLEEWGMEDIAEELRENGRNIFCRSLR